MNPCGIKSFRHTDLLAAAFQLLSCPFTNIICRIRTVLLYKTFSCETRNKDPFSIYLRQELDFIYYIPHVTFFSLYAK